MIRLTTALATVLGGAAAALTLAGASQAQPAGITMEMIERQLPEDGAPLAVVGPHAVTSEKVSDTNTAFWPTDLGGFPSSDTLPVVLWGNGGCAANPGRFSSFLETIASHGFLVVTTAGPEGSNERATAATLAAGLDWAEAENARAGSPLAGKIDLENVAAMGVSCGGMMALANAGDPRIDTVGVWNSGAQPPRDGAPAGGATTEALATLHGPTLYINGHEVDFAYEASKANFEALEDNALPAFYGARHNGGHSGTYFHPNGGEFANVAVDWVKWRLKGDEAAGATFAGPDCALCSNENWDVMQKGL